jgi:hypothetical protein
MVVAALALGGWGYGFYGRPAVAPDEVIAPAPTWVSPVGVIGLLAIIAVVALLLSGWHPFVVAR